MGFRVLLIGVTGKVPDAIQRDYGVAPTGTFEETPESLVVGATLPSGAYLLYINDPDRNFPDEKVFRKLSKGAELIACSANETVMHSFACGWSDGTERWSVSHDSQHGIEHLETSGNLPAELLPIHERLFSQQASDNEADFIFDIPVELFVTLGGIRYDQDIPGAGPNPWEILRPSDTAKKASSFWSWLPFRT